LATHTLHIRPDPGSGQTLTPGSGSNDEATPEAIGSGQYATASAIAAFDVVPDQTYGATFKIGVIAFHIHEDGIEKVSFQANGGDIVEVSTASLNSTSGVVEHWVELAVAADDGEVNVQAIVYPYTGTTKILTLRLYSNDDDTYPAAFRYVHPTAAQGTEDGSSAANALGPGIADAIYDMHVDNVIPDGAIIYLLAGTHEYASAVFPASTMSNSGPWLIITAAPGLDKTDVTVEPTGGAPIFGSLTRICWRDVTFNLSEQPQGATSASAHVWFDDVRATGLDRWIAAPGFGSGPGWGAAYMTDSVVEDMAACPNFWMRNTTIDRTLSGGPFISDFVVYCTVSDIISYLTGTDLTVDGSDNTLVTPDGYTPHALNVGQFVRIEDGGGWTGGDYEIIGVSDGKWELESSPAATSTTSGVWEHSDNAEFDRPHADVYSSFQSLTNAIFYGLETPGSGLDGSRGMILSSGPGVGVFYDYNDVAIVGKPGGSSITAGGGVGSVFWLGGNYYNLFVKDYTFTGSAADSDDGIESDVWGVFENLTFVGNTPTYQGVVVR
jgi:hypothetical protein